MDWDVPFPGVPPSSSFLWGLTKTVTARARARAAAASDAVLLPQVSGICRCCFTASDFIHLVAWASPIRDLPCPELPGSPLWFFVTFCLCAFHLVLLCSLRPRRVYFIFVEM